MWKNIVQRGRSQMTIWLMCIARSIPTATNTHSEYVILIAFPLQQWLHNRTTLLRYTYIAHIVRFYNMKRELMRTSQCLFSGSSCLTGSVMKGSSLNFIKFVKQTPYIYCHSFKFLVMWSELTWFMWSYFMLKWSEVKWNEVTRSDLRWILGIKVPCTLG
jgi:hypothetical protein